MTQTLEISVLAAAVWLRCGLWPLRRLPAGPALSDSLLNDLHRHLPAAMALGALSHVLGGAADAALASVLLLVGGANALYGGLQSLRSRLQTENADQVGWTVAVGGVALLLMVGPRGHAGTEFAWWGAALILGGAFHSWKRTAGAWQKWLGVVFGGLVVVGPGLVHGIWVTELAGTGSTPLHWLSALMTVVTGALLSLGFFVGASGSRQEAESDEPFVEGAAKVASLLTSLALAGGLAIAASVQVGPVLGVALFGPILSAVGALVLWNRGAARLGAYLARIINAFAWVSDRIQRTGARAGSVGAGGLRMLGQVLEGRAALLWMLVVVLALALAMVSP